MTSRFVQIHTLTSYPACLLNRDDAGFAKRVPFGGAIRTRISSQCLKRHWRTFEGVGGLQELGIPMSVRSRVTFERLIVTPLVAEGLDEQTVRAVTGSFMKEVLGESQKAKAKAKKGSDASDAPTDDAIQTGQITILGRPEVDFLREQVKAVCNDVGNTTDTKKIDKAVSEHLGKDGKANLKALRHGAGLDAALFGRMVTSDHLSRLDAAIHVAHALTVHAEETESDYFSAVDDLLQGEDGSLGSGHINSAELTSGLFYGYTVIDVGQLVSNLAGCPQDKADDESRVLAGQIGSRLLRLVAQVSPGAKKGSTAPYAMASMVMVECGASQPRTLANAFLRPVSTRPDVLANAYDALGTYVSQVDRMFGLELERRFAAIGETTDLGNALDVRTTSSVGDIASWIEATVRSSK